MGDVVFISVVVVIEVVVVVVVIVVVVVVVVVLVVVVVVVEQVVVIVSVISIKYYNVGTGFDILHEETTVSTYAKSLVLFLKFWSP